MINLVPQVPTRVLFVNEQQVKESITNFMNKSPTWCVLETHNANRRFPTTATLTYDFIAKSLTLQY